MIPHPDHIDTDPAAPTSASAVGPVIDLRDGPTTRVRVARHDNPFSLLSPPERMRLIIRVLCELVAYDELENTEEHQRTIRAAMDVHEARAARPGPRVAPAPDAVVPTSPAPGPTATGAPTSITG